MTPILNAMQNLDLFRGVSPGGLSTLAGQSRYRKYEAGAMLVGEEDSVRAFYVVLTGRVKLYKSSSEGKEQTLYLLGPGDPFGMCTAFAVDSFPANAMALKESGVLQIPGPVMEAVALKEPRLLMNIIVVLSDRLKQSMDLIESLSLKEIPERLASFLLHGLGQERGGGGDRLELAITQRELAKILGSTPEALSRVIRRLSEAGVLVLEGRSVRVLDRRALEGLAEGEA